MTEVLLVEDDPAARQGLELALRRLGYGVRAAGTGEAALDAIGEGAADVVVLDVMLPGLDGFEVCRRLRRSSDVPVIMLTARSDDFDIVGGLEAGADDYVVKPVEPRVLDARIRAVLRRMARAGSPAETYGELVIDRGSLIVRRDGREVSLTPIELRLLLVLSGSPRQVFSREQLLDLVWEHDYLGDSRLVDACVQRLRAKIETDTSEPRYIQTVRGFGYRFGPAGPPSSRRRPGPVAWARRYSSAPPPGSCPPSAPPASHPPRNSGRYEPPVNRHRSRSRPHNGQ